MGLKAAELKPCIADRSWAEAQDSSGDISQRTCVPLQTRLGC